MTGAKGLRIFRGLACIRHQQVSVRPSPKVKFSAFRLAVSSATFPRPQVSAFDGAGSQRCGGDAANHRATLSWRCRTGQLGHFGSRFVVSADCRGLLALENGEIAPGQAPHRHFPCEMDGDEVRCEPFKTEGDAQTVRCRRAEVAVVFHSASPTVRSTGASPSISPRMRSPATTGPTPAGVPV